jgi:hypothetical protein
MANTLLRAGRPAVLLALGCLLVVTGCALPPVADERPRPSAETFAAPPHVSPPLPARKPTAPAVALLEGPPREALPSALPAPGTHGGFERLEGLDENAAAQLLGTPEQRAEAPPATIWRYISRDCELDVYFYLDLQTKEMRALHYEVRSHDGADRPDQQCYDQFVAQQRTSAVSGADRSR